MSYRHFECWSRREYADPASLLARQGHPQAPKESLWVSFFCLISEYVNTGTYLLGTYWIIGVDWSETLWMDVLVVPNSDAEISLRDCVDRISYIALVRLCSIRSNQSLLGQGLTRRSTGRQVHCVTLPLAHSIHPSATSARGRQRAPANPDRLGTFSL